MIGIYYGMVSAAVLLFGLQFWFNRRYGEACGSGLWATLTFAIGTSAIGAAVLFALNGFRFEITLLSALIAALSAVNGIIYSLFSLRALARVNLSLYSVFSMLGGMVLPFLFGILFFDESITLGKSICVMLIVIALLCTVEGEKKGGVFDLFAIFLLNGMSGVLSKWFQAGDFIKTSATGFSLLGALFVVMIAGIALPFAARRGKIRLTRGAAVSLGACGICSSIGNLLLLIALSHLSASAQYPFVTGGVMICSTLLCYLTPEKPTARQLLAVALAFVGILALILIPI